MPLEEHTVSTLYREHGAALKRFARRWVATDADAEEVVQEAMLRVWRHAPDESTPLKPYLYRTVRNLVTDLHRLAERRPTTVGDDADLSEREMSPRPGLEAGLDRIIMEEALMQLSDKHRDVIVLMHYQGMSVAAAAEALGVPEGTVKSRCHQGLRRLRQVLDSWEVTR